jgi:hypothetical protein
LTQNCRPKQVDIFYIRVGSNYTTRGGQFVPVTKISIHNSYDPNHNDYDAAVLKLGQDLEFNDYVQPIALDDGTASVEENVEGVISGWGATEVRAKIYFLFNQFQFFFLVSGQRFLDFAESCCTNCGAGYLPNIVCYVK